MRTHTISALVASFVFALASLLPAPAQSQADSAQPAVQDSSSKPIGKVVTATGSVTIEHASAAPLKLLYNLCLKCLPINSSAPDSR